MTRQNLQPLPDFHGLLVCPGSAGVDPSLFFSLAKELIIQAFFSSLLCFAYGKHSFFLLRARAKQFLYH